MAESAPALVIFLLTYFVLGVGRLPGFRIDRTGAAVIGAGLMVGLGILPVEEAYRAIDYNTILLLFGVMIVVGNLRIAGCFCWIASHAVARAHSPLALLAVTVVLSGVLSAFFVNDTICLALTPLLLEVAAALCWNPVPFLLALATAANVGSAATITGNPQNMMIGSFSGIEFTRFLAELGPLSVCGLLIVFGVIAALYRHDLAPADTARSIPRRVRVHKPLLRKSLGAAAVMLTLFFVGRPPAEAALAAAAIVLITRRIKPERIYREIDFSLLVLFSGLFIVVAGFARTPLAQGLYEAAEVMELTRPATLSLAAAALSNLVSNVPAVLVFRPLLDRLADAETAWLTLAMASTFAGNLTIVGSIANLIVVQRARSRVVIGFWEYFRVGAPITVATLALGIFWLSLRG